MKYYSAKKISAVTEKSERWIRKRAFLENWSYREHNGKKEFDFEGLPEEIQSRILASQQVKSEEIKKIRDINLNNLKFGEARAYIVAVYKNDYMLSPEEFACLYNQGKINLPGKIREIYPAVSPTTLYRWFSVSPDGNLTELATGYKGKKGAGTIALNDVQRSILIGIYLKFKSFKMAKACRYFKEECAVSVSYSTVCRTLNSIPPAIRCLFRKGRRTFNEKFMPYIKMDYSLYDVMEYWDSDHHKIDAFVKDEDGNIYRPWLTVFQDVRSRKIVGWHIGRYASSWTIALAFKMAVLNYGAPKILKIDNGKDYKSKHMQGYTVRLNDDEEIRIQGLFKRFGVHVIFATPYHGQAKPVESWFKTLINDWSVTLPTYSLSNTVSTIKERDLVWKEVKEKIKLTPKELIASFEKWIVKWNATWEHSGDAMNGRSPDAVFNEEIKNCIRIDVEPEHLNYMFAKDNICTAGRNGVNIAGVEYYDPKLAMVKGTKVLVKKDIFDIGKVGVYELDGTFVCEAYNGKFRDIGVVEENLREVNRAKKSEKAIAKEYHALVVNGSTETFEERVINAARKNKTNRQPAAVREKKSLFM